ncbi:hypothetical protein D3C76_1860910 [compost metagenome]
MIAGAARTVARASTVLRQMKIKNCRSWLAGDGVSVTVVSTDTPSPASRLLQGVWG